MKERKIKEVVVRYKDGTEEVVKQGMLATADINLFKGQVAFRLRNFNMNYETTQNYYVGLMQAISQGIDGSLLDTMERDLEELEQE